MTIDEAWRDLWAEIERHGYGGLTRHQLLWVDTRAVIDATNNGGIISYFYNSNASRYYDCLSALDQLGATTVRQLLEEAGSLFGERVSPDQEVRNAIINAWDGGRYSAALDRLDHQLYVEFPALEERLCEFLEEKVLPS